MQATVASPEMFTAVLIISKTLSTARIIPIASKGRLNCWRIITNVIIPADGTAAVPIEVATANKTI